MDHYKNPRNKGLSSNSNYVNIFLSNPSCGDEITMQILFDGAKIKDIKHDGKGCSICCASSSMASEKLIGKDLNSIRKVLYNFFEMVKGGEFDESILDSDELSLAGVSNFPARIKCATLAWKAIEKAVSEKEE
jgi:nitrogen fixation NifU-like protein